MGKLNKKKVPKRRSTASISKSDYCWSEEELKRLYKAVLKFGYYNTQSIAQYVGTQSYNKVKYYLNNVTMAISKQQELKLCTNPKKCKMLAYFMSLNTAEKDQLIHNHQQHCKKPPLDHWAKKVKMLSNTKMDNSRGIAKAFLYISKMEDHPPPEECGGVDYKEIYNSLYYLCRGLPCKELSSSNSQFMLDSFEYLAYMFKIKNRDELQEFLNKPERDKRTARVYKSREKLLEKDPYLRSLVGLERMPGINPLSIPLNLLQRENNFLWTREDTGLLMK